MKKTTFNLQFEKTFILAIVFVLIYGIASGQNITQNIRGQLIDKDTKSPLAFANIVVLGSDPVLAATTDEQGYYVIKNVPIGKVSLKVSYLGYEEQIIPNVAIFSGKETQLNIEMEESYEQLQAVEVRPDINREEGLVEMALISSTTFSVEEAKRSPGTFNDPSRMASTFAGVSTDPEGNNDIIVRGNSPKGIQWRLEGIEIPNPNHFSDEGTSGGAINILNSDMMANSSFHTGAFAPQFGNAYSGIMDLELRTGNKAKREYSITGGVLGLEASMEGPFVKDKRASYLVNYRYSTLTLLDKIGIVDYGGVPEYQDGLFKIHVPTQKAGVFTVFGLGGISQINESYDNEEGITEYKGKYKTFMGVGAIKHSYSFSPNTYISSDFSSSINGGITSAEELSENESVMYQSFEDDLRRYTNALNTLVTHKFNSRHLLKVGVGYRLYNFDYLVSWPEEGETILKTRLKEKGHASLINGFVSHKYRITKELTMVSGVHYQQFLLNNAYTIEPRASLKWKFTEDQSLFGGIGMHSKLEPLTNYFSIVTDEFGNTSKPNTDLGFTKSVHYIVGYENRLTPYLTFKAEAYYQQLYNLPVENDVNSSESLINSYGYFNDVAYVNEGKGKNYGLELTLERYFERQYYFTFTASLYDSKYTAKDGVERNTRFNGNFALNAIGGKEFIFGKNDDRIFGFSGRFTWAGGGRYTPVLLDESIAEGEQVMDKANQFSERPLDFYKLNVALYYTKNFKRVSHTLKVEVENVTNNQAKLYEYYNSKDETIQYGSQMEMLPVIRYTLNF